MKRGETWFSPRPIKLHSNIYVAHPLEQVVSQFGIVAASRSDRDRFRRLYVRLKYYLGAWKLEIPARA